MEEIITDQIQYYSERALEYEKVYAKRERQLDLAQISDYLKDELENKQVKEIACGTGYWTNFISYTADSITASDINDSVLDIAKSKTYECPVNFINEDIFDLHPDSELYNAGFAGFIWSHIPRGDLRKFLASYCSKLKSGSKVIFIDNKFVENNSTPIYYQDKTGNSYQLRTLEDGSEHKVIKNYPSDNEIKELLRPYASSVEIIKLQYYWICKFIKI